MSDLLSALLAELDALPEPADAPLPPEPDRPTYPWSGRGRREAIGKSIERDIVTLEAGYAMARDAGIAYLDLESPPHILLLALIAGGGKTHLAVWLAHHLAEQGKKVLVFMPRHDFWLDLMEEVKKQGYNPDDWYHWQPRQLGNADKGKEETCRYTPSINLWMHKGHKSMDYCQHWCGFDYVTNLCPFHKQTKEAARYPIIACQHQHLTGNHPLMEEADVLIGDENPLSVFGHDWIIPLKHIIPDGLENYSPMLQILYPLQNMVTKTIHEADAKTAIKIDGMELLEAMGGAELVRDTCAGFDASEVKMTRIRTADSVDDAPYNYLPLLAQMLHRESEHALNTNEAYQPRVVAVNGQLHLLARNRVHHKAPHHIIWLDATADERIYEYMFKRPVKMVKPDYAIVGDIHYVDTSLNNKGSLIDKEDKPTEKVGQLNTMMASLIKKHGAKRPLVISHKSVVEYFAHHGQIGHFGGERGTNRFENCDIAFIVGVQQPALEDIIKTATMLLDDRMQPFDTNWILETQEFVGIDFAHGVSRFADPALNPFLWQMREAEVIQAAHRVRPARRKVIIYLFLNIPIDDLAPKSILNYRDLFGAPEGVDPFKWDFFRELVAMAREDGQTLDAAFIAEWIGMNVGNAKIYMAKLVAMEPDSWEIKKERPAMGRGGVKNILVPI